MDVVGAAGDGSDLGDTEAGALEDDLAAREGGGHGLHVLHMAPRQPSCDLAPIQRIVVALVWESGSDEAVVVRLRLQLERYRRHHVGHVGFMANVAYVVVRMGAQYGAHRLRPVHDCCHLRPLVHLHLNPSLRSTPTSGLQIRHLWYPKTFTPRIIGQAHSSVLKQSEAKQAHIVSLHRIKVNHTNTNNCSKA